MRVSRASLLGVAHTNAEPNGRSQLKHDACSLHHHFKYTVGSDDETRQSVSMRRCNKSILSSDLHESTRLSTCSSD